MTVDALNCQTEAARTIIDGGADRVFALKANHPQLHQAVVDWFEGASQHDFRDGAHPYAQTVDKAHGRLEIRQCWVSAGPLRRLDWVTVYRPRPTRTTYPEPAHGCA